MKHFNRLLWASVISCLILSGLFVTGCEEKKEIPQEFLARVGDSFLTKDDLKDSGHDYSNDEFYVKEFIKDWVKNEVLYQSALKEELNLDDGYSDIKEKSLRLILINMFIQQKIIEGIIDIEDEVLNDFYENNKDFFRAPTDLFILNVAEFKNSTDAEKYMSLDEFSFSERSEKFSEIGKSLHSFQNKTYYEYDMPSKEFYNTVRYLGVDEFSVVHNPEQKGPAVVQLVKRYSRGTILEFNLVRDKVLESYKSYYYQLNFREMVKKLSDNFDIEINEAKN